MCLMLTIFFFAVDPIEVRYSEVGLVCSGATGGTHKLWEQDYDAVLVLRNFRLIMYEVCHFVPKL